MKYRLVGDSSTDMTKEMQSDSKIVLVPFKIDIDDRTYVDDESLDLDEYIRHMNESPNPIKTACPSVGEWLEAFESLNDSDGIFAITISSKLSGSYHAAEAAKAMFLEKHPDKKLHIVDSKGAVSTQTNIFLELRKLFKENFDFEKIVEKIEKYRDEIFTLFVLEDLSNLVKNGRIKKTAGLIADVLSIKPVMLGRNGEIELYELSRGMKRSLTKMVEAIGKLTEGVTENRRLTIAHVRDLAKAEFVKEKAQELFKFAEINIIPMRGLGSGYASDKGIVISF